MKVVNVRHYGGIKEAENNGVVYVGRPSPLGNPYSFGAQNSKVSKFVVGSRDEAVEKYRFWLHHQLKSGNQSVIKALESLSDDSVLGCWCSPLSCHADIIIKAYHWWRNHGRSQLAEKAL